MIKIKNAQTEITKYRQLFTCVQEKMQKKKETKPVHDFDLRFKKI